MRLDKGDRRGVDAGPVDHFVDQGRLQKALEHMELVMEASQGLKEGVDSVFLGLGDVEAKLKQYEIGLIVLTDECKDLRNQNSQLRSELRTLVYTHSAEVFKTLLMASVDEWSKKDLNEEKKENFIFKRLHPKVKKGITDSERLAHLEKVVLQLTTDKLVKGMARKDKRQRGNPKTVKEPPSFLSRREKREQKRKQDKDQPPSPTGGKIPETSIMEEHPNNSVVYPDK